MKIQAVGPCPSKIMIVGEMPGPEELRMRQPFCGYAGKELDKMLSEAGIYRSQCFITNVLKESPPGDDIGSLIAERKKDITAHHVMLLDKMVMPQMAEAIDFLKREIEMCQPNVIIAVGETALWALTGNSGITKWRSSVIPCALTLNLDYKPKVVPTYSPAYILKQWPERRIMLHDLRRAKVESLSREIKVEDYTFIIRPNFNTVMSVLAQLHTQLEAAIAPMDLAGDLETRAGHIACIGIAWSAREALCIPLMCVEKPEGYWTPDQEFQIIMALKDVLTHSMVSVIGQNFMYDLQYFYRWLFFLPGLKHDTMLAQHSMFSTMRKSLDFLSSLYCTDHVYWKDDGKEWNSTIPEDSYWNYNCMDAVRTFAIKHGQVPAIKATGMEKVNNFQQKLVWPVLKTMNKGCRMDHPRKAQFAMELQEEIIRRNDWLKEVLGYELNIKSPVQMKELFYGQLNQKEVFNRKTRSVSCDDEAMRKMAEREPLLLPLVRKIQELRSLGVFLSTFVLAGTDTDGRMRCSYNVGGTETYRFSSSKNAFGTGLNLQNIPKGGEEADGLELPNVRTLFIPDEGKEFFDIDLDSADLRIVVWESDEREMKQMLHEGKKIYVEVMKEYYKDPSMTKNSPQYTMFKSFCHGTHYLGTAKGLAERLGLLVHESEQLQKWYFGKFPKIKQYQDDIKNQVLKRGYVENVFGYRSYFFDRIEGTIFNQAAAWIPQSTVGILINHAYVAIDAELPDVDILLQVHDSLAGQFDISKRDIIIPQIIQKAEIALPYEGDPLIIPVGIKTSTKSWGHCG